MPRIHPRCGTNLAVGSTFFLGIATNPLIQPDELRLLLALVLTVMLWRPLGALVQYWVTTKPPTDKQLMMGIRSGKELLAKQQTADRLHVNYLRRLWNSGIFHVMAGSFLILGFLLLLKAIFPSLPIPSLS